MNSNGNEVQSEIVFIERKPTVESAVVVKREAAFGELR